MWCPAMVTMMMSFVWLDAVLLLDAVDAGLIIVTGLNVFASLDCLAEILPQRGVSDPRVRACVRFVGLPLGGWHVGLAELEVDLRALRALPRHGGARSRPRLFSL